MLNHLIILGLFGTALAYAVPDLSEFSATTPRGGISYVDYFDCSSTTKQHNKHPFDCTRFIQCDAWGSAFDMPCAACSDQPLCPGGGYLHFDGVPIDGKEPSCIWPAHSTCVAGPGGPTTTTTTTTTPTTTTSTTTTTAPTTTTTTPTTTTTKPTTTTTTPTTTTTKPTTTTTTPTTTTTTPTTTTTTPTTTTTTPTTTTTTPTSTTTKTPGKSTIPPPPI